MELRWTEWGSPQKNSIACSINNSGQIEQRKNHAKMSFETFDMLKISRTEPIRLENFPLIINLIVLVVELTYINR